MVPTHSLPAVPLPLLPPQFRAVPRHGSAPTRRYQSYSFKAVWLPQNSPGISAGAKKPLEKELLAVIFWLSFSSYWNARVNDGIVVFTRSWIWAPLHQAKISIKHSGLTSCFVSDSLRHSQTVTLRNFQLVYIYRILINYLQMDCSVTWHHQFFKLMLSRRSNVNSSF